MLKGKNKKTNIEKYDGKNNFVCWIQIKKIKIALANEKIIETNRDETSIFVLNIWWKKVARVLYIGASTMRYPCGFSKPDWTFERSWYLGTKKFMPDWIKILVTEAVSACRCECQSATGESNLYSLNNSPSVKATRTKNICKYPLLINLDWKDNLSFWICKF